MIDAFHFIRPWWLLTLLPVAILIGIIWRHQDSNYAWRRIMDPHLLSALMTGQSKQQTLRPVTLMAALWLLGTLSLAGPTWSLEPSPFAEDQAALIIVLKVTASMDEQDVQPSRAERAVQKIHDLLEERSGSRAALIAYSGSAHLVMPLTKDAGIINSFATDLSPKIMPREGDAATEALALAKQQLKNASLSGSILFIADSLPDSLNFSTDKNSAPVQVLGMIGNDGIDSLRSAAQKSGSAFTPVTVDDSDVSRLSRLIETSFSAKADENDSGKHWQDRGWWLTIVIAGLGLWWFRPGWVIAWN
ncbi:MAG: VWA domain-containing protein [Verrucomicrobiales bacterium]|nr:VWA domain-containing protein [Verrucomicrobiales bacterium]